MRVVLDTSVLVAGLLSGRGAAAEVVEQVFRSTLVVLYDQRILDEYREVLARSEFAAIDPEEVDALLFVLGQGEPVTAAAYAGTMVDEDDRPFIEVALSGGADVVLTHNPKDFTEQPGLPVMKPGEWAKQVAHWLTKPNPRGHLDAGEGVPRVRDGAHLARAGLRGPGRAVAAGLAVRAADWCGSRRQVWRDSLELRGHR